MEKEALPLNLGKLMRGGVGIANMQLVSEEKW